MSGAINDYSILTVIGTGSFGTCYKVLKKVTGEIFVWKAVDYGKMTEEKKKLLVSEVNLLSSLNHPNIVKYHDRIVYKPTTTIYIVMEWCAGGDLSTLISQCKKTDIKLDEKFVWRVLYQLARALQVCHLLLPQGPVLHRDIKPANVFLDGNGNVKLGDFGLAYLLQEGRTSVLSSGVVGTPFYMSPEAIQDNLYSEKSDIWSLGCLVYELCTLQPPFDGSNLQQLIRRVQAGRFSRIPLDYSDDLQKIIIYMLTVDYNVRPNVEMILHCPDVIVHIVQESLEAMELESCCNETPRNDCKVNKLERDLPHFPLLSCSCIEEVARLKDTLYLKMSRLKEWESILKMRELEISEKERSFIKREKQVAVSESLVKEKVTQAELYLRYCQTISCGSSRGHKTEASCNSKANFSVFTDEGDTSIMPPTSAKLNPCKVERPQVFSRIGSEKRVHFGTLPGAKCKNPAGSVSETGRSSFRSISHLLIDGYNVKGSSVVKLPNTQVKTEKYGKLKGNKTKKLSGAVEDCCKSCSSASSNPSDKAQWNEDRKHWLEQKRALFFCNNKENIPSNTNFVSRPKVHSSHWKSSVAMEKNNFGKGDFQ